MRFNGILRKLRSWSSRQDNIQKRRSFRQTLFEEGEDIHLARPQMLKKEEQFARVAEGVFMNLNKRRLEANRIAQLRKQRKPF